MVMAAARIRLPGQDRYFRGAVATNQRHSSSLVNARATLLAIAASEVGDRSTVA